MLVSRLVEDAVKIVHDSPVECLGGILRLIVSAVGCDYGLILTRDPQKQALSVDVLEGYADELTTAYRSARIKLPVNETQSVSARALAEANRERKPVFILLSGDDPTNYQIAPVEQTLACAVGSVGEYGSVLVLERKARSTHEAFVDTPELRVLVDTCVQLVSIALAARQSFVFRFDEFMKQAAFVDIDSLSKDVGQWVYEKFGVALCSLYFVEYNTQEGKDSLLCKQRVVKGISESDGGFTKLALGEDYAGWIAANNSSLITFTDSKRVIHITSASVPEAQLQAKSKLSEVYPSVFVKSYLGVPITDGGQVIGVLEVVDSDREYSYSDEELLEIIADRIGSECVRISRDVRRESLFDIPNIETRDLRLVIRGVVDTAMKVAAATHGLFMFKDESGVFTPKAVRGHGLDKTLIKVVKVGDEDLINWVMTSPGKPAFVSGDIRSNQDLDPRMQQLIDKTLAPHGFIPSIVRSVLMVPIYLKDASKEEINDLGVLVLMSPRPNVFQRDEVVITALAEIVSYHIWANKKTAELESTSEKVNQLEQAMPHYNKAAMAAAASAGTVHSAKKHVKELQELIEKLNEHQKVKETRELLEIARPLQKQFSELADLYDKLHRVFRGSQPTFEPCDLVLLVQEVRSYMEPTFRERHVVFKNLVANAKVSKVSLDPILMKVVFINLINNSINAGAREISVGAKNTSMVTAGVKRDAVEMTFRDNGAGILPEHLPKIFELFYTGNPKEGTGLGLAVNFDILQKHGGTIQVVSSSPGHGTVFSVVWPMDPP